MPKRPYLILAPLVALAWMASASGPLGPMTFPDTVNATLTQDDVDALVRGGVRSLGELERQAGTGPETARGWSVVGIARIGGPQADGALERIHDDANQSPLVRSWAYSARLQMADELDQVLALAGRTGQFPGSDRPLELALERVSGGITNVGEALSLMATLPNMAPMLAQAVLDAPASEIVDVMLGHEQQNVRWQAASYAATVGQTRKGEVAKATHAALRYNPRAQAVPWDGGALYIPGIQWSRSDARAVIGELASWYAWAQRNNDSTAMGQVQNNLQSVSLLRAAGYNSMQDALGGDR